MELKNLSENCLECACKTCKNTYELDDDYFACFTWCNESCKGLDDPEKDPECYSSIEGSKQIDISIVLKEQVEKILMKYMDVPETFEKGYMPDLFNVVPLRDDIIELIETYK